jgi:hypothetical protein
MAPRHNKLIGVQRKKLMQARQKKLTRPPLSTPSEKLAESLKVFAKLQHQHAGAIRASDLSRTHRERLLKQGFLLRVMNGWLIPSRPDNLEGESTAWYASYWRFCAVYLRGRFKTQWCLSPEQSLSIHAGSWTVPKQLVVRAPKARKQNHQSAARHQFVRPKSEPPDRTRPRGNRGLAGLLARVRFDRMLGSFLLQQYHGCPRSLAYDS